MQAGADQVLMEAQSRALATLKDPGTIQMLAAQGVRPLIKELLIDNFNGSGLPDAEKYFETIQQAPMQSDVVNPAMVQSMGEQNGQPQIGISGGNGPAQPLQQQGVPNPIAPPVA